MYDGEINLGLFKYNRCASLGGIPKDNDIRYMLWAVVSIFSICKKILSGGILKWLKRLVLKTKRSLVAARGFKSLFLRHMRH